MKSPLWLNTVVIPDYPVLKHDVEGEICIVGGGMTGIILAYLLRDSNQKIILIDSDKLLHGTTAFTTAKLTAQHQIIYHDLIKNFGEYQAKLYSNAQQEAIEFVASLNIDCDFERKTAYVYTRENGNVKKIENEYEAALKLNIDCELLNEIGLPFSIETALAFHNQAQFNPLKFLVGILKILKNHPNIHIYEQTAAAEIKEQKDGSLKVITKNDVQIHVRKVVQTCHFPFYDGFSLLFSKIEARASYLLAAKSKKQKLSGMYISCDAPASTFRQYEDFLLIGGEDHRVGTALNTLEKYENIRLFAKENFDISDNEIEFEWSAQDYLTTDKIPFIGSINDSNIYVATGYQKWGMSNSCVAAHLLYDLLNGKENPNKELFNPQRSNLRAETKRLIVYNGRVAYELLKGKLKLGKENLDLENNQHEIIQTEDGKYGVFKDDSGEIYMLDVTCPHLGCELNFNQAEKTWDCPCHGSRFSYKGDIVQGPAHHNLKASKNKIDPNLF